jgi:hypothetical protein
MDAAGARVFAGGLTSVGNAKSLRAQPDGKVLVTDGPHTETKEHMGGSGYLKPLIWTRHWRGAARLSSPAGRKSRCARFFSTPTRREQRSGSDNTAGGAGPDGPVSGAASRVSIPPSNAITWLQRFRRRCHLF